jgi:hypothetical protein
MLVGNLLDIDPAHPIESLMELARKYGPIFEHALPGGRSRIVVSSFEIQHLALHVGGAGKRADARSPTRAATVAAATAIGPGGPRRIPPPRWQNSEP